MRKWLLIVLAILLLAACNTQEEPETTEPETEEVTEAETEPAPETEPETEPVTEAAKPEPMFSARYPIAVMIDNHPQARPQSGLQNADIIYELQVEGRLTRLLVVTDEETGEIGPIRSARPAFLNFVAENEAFYLHVGNFEYVQVAPVGDVIKDMDQFFHGGNAYYRVDRKVQPHNMYADIAQLHAAADSEGYTLKPEEAYGYLRMADPDLPEGEPAETMALTYDSYLYQRYEYDAAKNGYVKFINDEPVVDERTGDPLLIAAYISLPLEHWLMENGEHWAIGDVGEGDATLYTAGRKIPIRWNRADHGEPMEFTIDGEPVVFPEGLLYVQVTPPWVEVE
ncbi:MAG: DUF3048 domain-containing protein [Peptoniphilaceae bacterium]|jgi:hypothetical protein